MVSSFPSALVIAPCASESSNSSSQAATAPCTSRFDRTTMAVGRRERRTRRAVLMPLLRVPAPRRDRQGRTWRMAGRRRCRRRASPPQDSAYWCLCANGGDSGVMFPQVASSEAGPAGTASCSPGTRAHEGAHEERALRCPRGRRSSRSRRAAPDGPRPRASSPAPRWAQSGGDSRGRT